MARKAQPSYITEQGIFPQRLKALMKETKTSQKALGAAIGMRPQTVSLYMNGQSSPDINCLYRIASYFNVSADWLIGLPNSVKVINADAEAALKYTGLTEDALNTLHNLNNADMNGTGVKGYIVSYTGLLSDVLADSNAFFALFHEIALYMVYGGALPEQAYETHEKQLSVKELERFHRWANGHRQEIVSRDDARELHLQLAGKRLKDICERMLEYELKTKEEQKSRTPKEGGGDTGKGVLENE